MEFRRRQQMRAAGAPSSEYGVGADPCDNWKPPEGSEKPEGQDGYTEPTEEQKASVNELFETMLTDKTPDGFGDMARSHLDGEVPDGWRGSEVPSRWRGPSHQ